MDVMIYTEQYKPIREYSVTTACLCVCAHMLLMQENKWMKQCLEEEQKSRKELERVVKKLAKGKNDCVWEDATH